MKTPKTRMPLLLQGITTRHQQGNKAGWRKFDELIETDFRRWVITNFSEIKEHVLTQCKETKIPEQKFDEMLMRINHLETNISELTEL